MKRILSLLVFCAVFVTPCAFADSKATDFANIIERAKLVEKANKQKGFNGALIVAYKGETIYSTQMGYADKDKSQALNSSHVFSTGSVGKEFTTVALLMLQQQGRVNFSEVISTYLPSLPSWASKVTIQQLLSHTSGLPKINWLNNITTTQVVSQIQGISTLQFEPGSAYLYGNLNVVLRALIVEKITNQTFKSFIHQYLFEPIGINNSFQVTDLSELTNNIVYGDSPTAINGVTVYMTIADLLKWERALITGKLLGGEPLDKFIKQNGLSNKNNHANLDFGRFSLDDKNIIAIEHDGSNPSHHVVKYSNLAQNFTYIGMSSDGNKQTLRELRDSIIGLLSH